jgi:hypothetical protein
MDIKNLRSCEMMAHLLDSLEEGKSIGHYGRLVFAIVARHFISEQDLLSCLLKDQSFSEQQARALLEQVSARDYSPPKRERILEWQKEQDFPICPEADDPDACNVYKDLRFPDSIYEHINDYYIQKARVMSR